MRGWWLVGLVAGCTAASGAQPGPAAPAAPPPGVTPSPPSTSSAGAAGKASLAGGWGKFRSALPLLVEASSEYPGWHPEFAVDGDLETSWFSATSDTTTRGKQPWLRLSIGREVKVSEVRVMGNRHPKFPTGYSVLQARLELLGRNDRPLYARSQEALPPLYDLSFRPPSPLDGVVKLVLTVERDQGDRNPYLDVAVGEIQIEEAE